MKFIPFLLLFVSVTAHAACDHMFAFGKPIIETTEQVVYLCRKMYVVEHSPSKLSAYWSAERMLGKQQGRVSERLNAFKPDPNLPKGKRSEMRDYVGSGFDKGHLSPVGDMHADPKAMLESFYLSNMVPQLPENNRIGWRSLEYKVRGWAMKRSKIFVITGPIYQGETKTIGPNKVAVPSHLFKIIYDPKTNEALSFVVPNVPISHLDLPKFISDISTVEQLTRIKFFPTVTEPIQDSHTMWAK